MNPGYVIEASAPSIYAYAIGSPSDSHFFFSVC